MPETNAISPAEYAGRLGVGIHKILAWIKAGELAAVNVASKCSSRPQWRLPPSAIEAFERNRAAQPPATKTRRLAAKSQDYTKYF